MGPACSFPASMERNLMPDPFSSSDLPANSVRVPPHSVESEQTILGGLMLNTQAFDQISDIITAEDFYRADHRVIFDAIAALHLRGEPADVITVYNELERSGRADAAGGRPYLNALTSNSLGAGNIRTYAEIVRDCSMLRQLVSAADTIAASALAPEGRETKDIIDDAEKLVLQINESADRGNKGFVRLKKLAANVSDIVAERYRTKSANDVTGVSTGYRYLDQQTSGMQPGDLIIIAGRPSMGKTALALNIAEHVAMAGDNSWPVAVFSMEMSGEQLAMRLICSHGRLDAQKVRKGRLDEDGERLLDLRLPPVVAQALRAQTAIEREIVLGERRRHRARACVDGRRAAIPPRSGARFEHEPFYFNAVVSHSRLFIFLASLTLSPSPVRQCQRGFSRCPRLT